MSGAIYVLVGGVALILLLLTIFGRGTKGKR